MSQSKSSKEVAVIKHSDDRRAPILMLLDQKIDVVKRALPNDVSPQRFIDSVGYALMKNPELSKVSNNSLFAAALECAKDGLVPDGREAAFVTYRGSVTYMPMIAGVYKLAMRNTDLQTFGAETVHSNDTYRLWNDADGEHFLHELNLEDRGRFLGVVAYATYKDGRKFTEWVSKEDLAAIQSASSGGSGGPWVKYPNQMRKKSAIHRLARRLNLGEFVQRVVERDHAFYDFDEARPRVQHAKSAPVASVALDALAELPEVVENEETEHEQFDEVEDMSFDDVEVY